MSLTNLFLKVEIEHDEDDRPERLGEELCRQLLKFYGVRTAELSSYTVLEDQSMARKKKTFDIAKEVRAIARERVGTVPAAKPIPPRSSRKPKHKNKAEDAE